MKTESYSCDVCKKECKHNVWWPLEVIFETEQDEWRWCTPYFEKVTLDLCNDCNEIRLSWKYIFATGSQGYNSYYFK